MRILPGVVLAFALIGCGGNEGATEPDLAVADDEQPGANWPLAPDPPDGGEESTDLAGADLSGSPMDLGTSPHDLAVPGDAGVSLTRLVAHPKGSDGSPSGYYSYVPPQYPSGTTWPLLIALHGVGENGNQTTELVKVLNAGIGKLINTNKWPNARPFVVLMPQHTGVNNCPNATEIKNFINWATTAYAIDPKRVYLTGLSCGAIGAWAYLGAELDNKIAAMVPIAGNGKSPWAQKGCALGKVAIWAFHGDADPKVNVSGTNVPMDGLAACPSPPRREAKKTIYPGATHDTWTFTYDLSKGNDIYTWLLGITHP